LGALQTGGSTGHATSVKLSLEVSELTCWLPPRPSTPERVLAFGVAHSSFEGWRWSAHLSERTVLWSDPFFRFRSQPKGQSVTTIRRRDRLQIDASAF
jgi:hypothetical protein